MSDGYKKRVEVLTLKNNEVEERSLKGKCSFQSQQQLHEKKKKASEKLTQDHPDVSNVLIYHIFSGCYGMLALSGVDTACFGHQYTDFGHANLGVPKFKTY